MVGAVVAYHEMLKDEVNPDGMTHCLMSVAHSMMVCAGPQQTFAHYG